MNSYNEYLKRKQVRQEAEAWINLLKDRDHGGSCFQMSPVHGQLKLMICGQHSSGGKNYWDSPDTLNKVLLKVIAQERHNLLKIALTNLKQDEQEALVACEGELKKHLAEIEGAK
jgi:hypothetical protein